jgi:hypothetical protein
LKWSCPAKSHKRLVEAGRGWSYQPTFNSHFHAEPRPATMQDPLVSNQFETALSVQDQRKINAIESRTAVVWRSCRDPEVISHQITCRSRSQKFAKVLSRSQRFCLSRPASLRLLLLALRPPTPPPTCDRRQVNGFALSISVANTRLCVLFCTQETQHLEGYELQQVSPRIHIAQGPLA